MDVVAEESWSWMLYKDHESYYLSVVCGTVALYTRDLKLETSEVDEYSRHGLDFIKALASKICYSSEAYVNRHLASFDERPEVKEAAQRWRQKRNASDDVANP